MKFRVRIIFQRSTSWLKLTLLVHLEFYDVAWVAVPQFVLCNKGLASFYASRVAADFQSYKTKMDSTNSIFHFQNLTKIRRVIVLWANETGLRKATQHFALLSGIKDLSVGQNQDIVEQLEQSRPGLMDHADHNPAIMGQPLEMADHLVTGHAVQAACGFVEEHDGRIRHQLNGDR